MSAGLCHQLVHRTAIQLEMLARVLLGGLREGNMLEGVPLLPHLLAGGLNPGEPLSLAAGPVREPVGIVKCIAVCRAHVVRLKVRLLLADSRWLEVGLARRRREGAAARFDHRGGLGDQVATVVQLLAASLPQCLLSRYARELASCGAA